MTGTFLADYALTAQLAEDAFGTLHRAVRVEQGRHQRHALVRRFRAAALQVDLPDRLGEAIHLSTHLGDARGLMPRCRIHRAAEPFVSYDHLPGRTLAQVIRASREQHLPLGLEHTLTLLRDLSRALDQLHERGLEDGLLVPELVWVTYEGGVMWLDVPLMGVYREALRGAAALGPASGSRSGWSQDLRSLAFLGWQMLTAAPEVPRAAEDLMAGLARWSERSGQVLGPRIERLFRRMVGLEKPFEDREAFHREAGEVLRIEDQGPSTFSLSLFMHTLFRDALAAEERAMAAERVATFGKPLPPQDPAPMLIQRRTGRRPLLVASAGALALAGAGAWIAWGGGSGEAETLRRALAVSQRRQSELEAHEADLARKLTVPKAEPAPVSDPVPEPASAPTLPPVSPAPLRVESHDAPAPAPVLQAPAGGQAAAKLVHLDPPSSHAGPGQVRLQVYLNEEGRPLRAMPMEPAPPARVEAAKAAALHATYRPAWREGRRVRDWLEVVVACR